MNVLRLIYFKKHMRVDCCWQESSEQKDEIASLKATVAGMTGY